MTETEEEIAWMVKNVMCLELGIYLKRFKESTYGKALVVNC